MTAGVAPGLYGLISRRGRADIATLFARMCDRRPSSAQFEALVDRRCQWAIGRVHLGILQPSPQLHDNDAVHVLYHGDLHNIAEIQGRLGGSAGGPAQAGSAVAGLYAQMGPAFASTLDGAYGVALLDSQRHRLVVATDALASYPLYWTATNDGIAFGSEAAALLRHSDVRRQLDPAAVADYVTFGFPLGVKTLAAGVELVPPGAALIFDWDTGTATVNRHSDLAEWFQPWTGDRAEYFDALTDAFRRAVARAMSGQRSLGLSLSGGLDSRAILSAANGQAPALKTYTLGVKGCADEVIANRLANIAGTHHTFFELDERYLDAFLPNLERLVQLTDGMYLTHGLTEMLALRFLSSADFSVLLRGHGGELAKTNLAWPLHTDDRIKHFTSRTQLVPYLLTRANYISSGVDLTEIFTDSWHRRIRGAAAESLAQSIARIELAPSDLCSYLYLNEHHRRFTTASLAVFRQAVEVRLPFVDTVFLRVLFRGPADWRADTAIHRALTQAGNAALLRVRNANTGAPADAGPLTELVLEKMNALFRRLNLSGYRHYHSFPAWMSEQLLSSVDAVLLSPASLERGILQERGIRRLLDETRQNRADHSYLLQTLLILELWLRQDS